MNIGNIMKKIFLIFPLLLISCSNNNSSIIKYSFNIDKKTATVVKGNYFNNIIIPSSVNYNNEEYVVDSISVECFKDNKNIKKVSLPSTMKNIGYDAFKNSSLEEIDLGGNVEILADHLFSTCTSLKSVTGLDNVKQILKGTFENTHLEKLSFNNLTSVGIDAFFNNKYLKEISLLGDLVSISGSSFERCPLLNKVNLSNNIVNIDSYAFKDCKNLKEIDLKNITSFGKNAFENCSSLNKVNLYSKELPYALFKNCSSLVDVSLNNVEYIGPSAFYKTNINSININKEVKEIGSNAFYECNLSNLVFEDNSSLEHISFRSFYHNNLKEINLPSSIKYIYNEAFKNNKIKKVILNKLTNIDSNVFDDNVEIERI